MEGRQCLTPTGNGARSRSGSGVGERQLASTVFGSPRSASLSGEESNRSREHDSNSNSNSSSSSSCGGGGGSSTTSGESAKSRRDANLAKTAVSDDSLAAPSCLAARASSALSEIVCVDEFEQMAKGTMEKSVYDYFAQGSDDQVTLGWNRSMLSKRWCLRPRIMCDVSRVDLTKYIYGDKLSAPIGISPTAMHKMAHKCGELATVRAVGKINALMVLSFFSTTSLENVAKEAPIATKWQNIYIFKKREMTQNVINRAVRYGYRALVVTCDAPVLGNRRLDVKNKFTLGQHRLENIEDEAAMGMREHSSALFDPSVSWLDLADLKKSVGDTIKVIAKGVMSAEDAELALQCGVDGIFVSNHGGRQLDGCPATIEVLADVVAAVNKRCPVFVDGGFRSGADILKALALGADMVFIGRPVLWALATHGEDGVSRLLELLRDELRRAMMFCGCKTLADVSRRLLFERSLT